MIIRVIVTWSSIIVVLQLVELFVVHQPGFFHPEERDVAEASISSVLHELFRRRRASLLAGEDRLEHHIRLNTQRDLLSQRLSYRSASDRVVVDEGAVLVLVLSDASHQREL